MNNWIFEQIRIRAKRTILLNVVICLLWVGYGVYQHRYINDCIHTPLAMTQADLASIKDIKTASRTYVTITGEQAIPSGYRSIEVQTTNGSETGRSFKGEIYFLVVGNQIVLVKGSENTLGGRKLPLTAAGILKPRDSKTDEIVNDPDVVLPAGKVCSFYLDTQGSFRTSGYVLLAILLLYLYMAFRAVPKALKYLSDPSTHPEAVNAAAWGEPTSVAMEMERDCGAGAVKCGSSLAGQKYLVHQGWFDFKVSLLADVAWIYRRVVKKKAYGVISTGSENYLEVLFINRKKTSIQGNAKETEAIIEHIAQRVPWAVKGYSKELADMIAKNPQGLFDAVAAKRRESGNMGQSTAFSQNPRD